jgi:CheY-like chemotaxis protein
MTVHMTAQEPTGKTVSILLVDDQPDLRELTADFLREIGYSVTCASSSAEALNLAREIPEIDLVISDIALPKISGPDLMERLLLLHPKTPVLFMSGYAFDIPGSPSPFLQKPYSLELLAQKIQELLASKAGI